MLRALRIEEFVVLDFVGENTYLARGVSPNSLRDRISTAHSKSFRDELHNFIAAAIAFLAENSEKMLAAWGHICKKIRPLRKILLLEPPTPIKKSSRQHAQSDSCKERYCDTKTHGAYRERASDCQLPKK
jgi:hypothetical protein